MYIRRLGRCLTPRGLSHFRRAARSEKLKMSSCREAHGGFVSRRARNTTKYSSLELPLSDAHFQSTFDKHYITLISTYTIQAVTFYMGIKANSVTSSLLISLDFPHTDLLMCFIKFMAVNQGNASKSTRVPATTSKPRSIVYISHRESMRGFCR